MHQVRLRARSISERRVPIGTADALIGECGIELQGLVEVGQRQIQVAHRQLQAHLGRLAQRTRAIALTRGADR